MMRIKRGFVFFAIFWGGILGALLWGCAESKKIVIGLSLPDIHVKRWQRDGALLQERAADLGYSTGLSFAGTDQELQNLQIRDFVRRGARLLIIGAVDSAGVKEIVAEVVHKGVTVIAYDRLILDSDDYEYYVTFDNFEVGRMQAQSILDQLQGREGVQQVALFAGALTDNNAKVFFDGAMSRLLPALHSERISIVGPAPVSSLALQFPQIATAGWQPSLAGGRMQELLRNEARDRVLAAVLSPSDILSRAIISALRADKKYRSLEQFPLVTGQDAELESVGLIEEGWQYMTVFKDTRKLATAAIMLANSILKRQPLPSVYGTELDHRSYHTGKKFVTSYLISPVLVTRENLGQELVASGFYRPDQVDFLPSSASEASGSEASGSEASGSGASASEASGSGASASEASGGGTSGGGTSGSGASGSGASGSGASASGTSGGGTSGGGTSGGGTSGGGTSGGGTSGGGTSGGGTSGGGTSGGGTSGGGTSASGTSGSGTSGSGTSGSGTSASGTSASGTSASGTSASGISNRETAGSETKDQLSAPYLLHQGIAQ